jgi:hypothetical protein
MQSGQYLDLLGRHAQQLQAMRILTRRDMDRWEAVARKVERMAAINQTRRYPVSGWSPESGGDMPIPTDRKTIVPAVETQLTRADRDLLLWWDDSVWTVDGVLNLPADPVVGDTLWFALWPKGTVYIRPARNHGIYAPVPTHFPPPSGLANKRLCIGYWFDDTVAGVAPHYYSDQISIAALYSTIAMTWLVMTYTGETEQVPIGYNDVGVGGPGPNPNPGDGNGFYYDLGIDTLVYAPITMWTVWRVRGRVPGIHTWKGDDFPY